MLLIQDINGLAMWCLPKTNVKLLVEKQLYFDWWYDEV